MSFSNTNLLVVAPHADDQVLGCGGLIQRVVEEGGNVIVALVATFLQADFGKWNKDQGRYEQYRMKQRCIEFHNCMKQLTDGKYKVCEYDDVCRTFDDRAYMALFDKHIQNRYVSFFQGVIKENNINMVCTPVCSYYKDHNYINQAVRAACRPHFYQGDLMEYSVGNQIQFVPNCFVKLSEQHAQNKVQSFKKYVTQVSPSKHSLSCENIMDRLRIYGRFIYSDYAQPYILIRKTIF